MTSKGKCVCLIHSTLWRKDMKLISFQKSSLSFFQECETCHIGNWEVFCDFEMLLAGTNCVTDIL